MIRLDFDASSAPKKCNDSLSFQLILGDLVDENVIRADATRRLIVRIRSSSTGGKRADVSLVDAQGVTLAERHLPYAATTECYRVLWEVAREAARLLGAFEPPPPKEPVLCPPSPSPTPPPAARSYPVYIPPVRHTPITTPNPNPHGSFIGLGAVVTSGIYSEMDVGPYLLLGLVPWPRFYFMHVELEGAWTSQTLPSSLRVHSVPIVGSLCIVRDDVRFCGGLAMTMFFSNSPAANDELLLHFAGNLRVGTELFSRDPFVIRADVFGRFAFAERRFGDATMAINEPTPFTAGLAVMGAWR